MTRHWFTSDHHFGHATIIKYTHRPFSSVQEMNETLIYRWNERVSPTDIVYHLGDLTCIKGKKDRLKTLNSVLPRLNGHICFIRGNHDRIETHERFMWSDNLREIRVPYGDKKEQLIVLCHYAMRVWNKSHYGSWMLWGHSHGSLKEDPHALSFDVGVDTNNYYPYSFEEVQERMSTKVFQPVDHHGREP